MKNYYVPGLASGHILLQHIACTNSMAIQRHIAFLAKSSYVFLYYVTTTILVKK